MAKAKPSKMPTQELKAAEAGEMLMGQSMPAELSATDITMMTAGAVSVPTLEPPLAKKEEVLAAWVSGKQINALWGINQNRNSWVYVSDVGWKKLANNSDSAIVALTILTSHAKQLNCPVDYREEADNMIHEICVW